MEVVRRFNGPHEGENVIPMVRAALDRLGPEPRPEAILALWADDPGWKYAHPDIEWDTSATGAIGSVARGASEVGQWWTEWSEAWESYVYRSLGYSDLRACVLNPVEVQARTRDGMSVEMTVFQLWQVRDGKVAMMRAFLSEGEAFEAAARVPT